MYPMAFLHLHFNQSGLVMLATSTTKKAKHRCGDCSARLGFLSQNQDIHLSFTLRHLLGKIRSICCVMELNQLHFVRFWNVLLSVLHVNPLSLSLSNFLILSSCPQRTMKTKKTPKRKPSTPKKKTAEMFLSRKDLEGNYVSATSQLQYVKHAHVTIAEKRQLQLVMQ